MDNLNAINEKIIALKTKIKVKPTGGNQPTESTNNDNSVYSQPAEIEHKSRVFFDATACPHDIAYPTDLNLLNDALDKLEELIDIVYNPTLQSG